MQESSSPNKALVAVIIIVLLAAITAGTVYVMNSRSDEDAQTTQISSSTNDETSTTSATEDTTASYKDGSYSASGMYSSPGGQEEVEVRLTLTNSVITDINVTTDPASGTSSQYQSEFKNGYKKLVLGKNISEVKLSRVAGSSLTSTGFNNALDKIKTDAV